MKAYKGFDKNMQCHGFQYEECQTYETDTAELCESGFHACECPLDVFGYYAPGGGSIYREVELEEVSEQRGFDSKRVGKKITIGGEIGIPGLVKAYVEWVKEQTTENQTSGNYSALRGGDYSALQSGNYSALRGGDYSALQSGYSSALRGGDYSALQSGNSSALRGGDSSVLYGRAGSKFCGGMWSVFACPMIKDRKIVSIATAVVDGETIKPNTWYTLRDGEFVEVEE